MRRVYDRDLPGAVDAVSWANNSPAQTANPEGVVKGEAGYPGRSVERYHVVDFEGAVGRAPAPGQLNDVTILEIGSGLQVSIPQCTW